MSSSSAGGWVDPPPGTGPSVGNGAANISLSPKPWVWRDPTTIPPRPWLLGTMLQRGYTTLLGGTGGTGKTAVAVAASLAVITGDRHLLGRHTFRRGNVWYVTLEDDAIELERRFAAAILAHELDPLQIEGHLFINGGPLQLAAYQAEGRTVSVVRTADADELVEYIKQNNILLIVLDPLVKAHGIDGNRNEDMDVFMRIANDIARETNCAVLLPCHFRKGGNAELSPDSIRGASAQVDGARIAYLLARMTAEEAVAFGIPEAETASYIRMVDGKTNMAPPAKATDWLQIVPIALGNTTVDPDYPAGDSVQAVKLWQQPTLFDDMILPTLEAVFSAINDPTRVWHASAGGGRNWVGEALETIAGKSREQAKRIVNLWFTSGTLVVESYRSADRKQREKVAADPAKVAAILAGMATPTPSLTPEA